MEVIDQICSALIALLGLLALHKSLYLVLGFLAPARQYPETERRFRYAVVIAARNEARVIGNLIDSIRGQDYGEVEIFVVADNCTDDTAAICRQLGATVYERFDPDRRRKGYALQFLFEQIERDYGIGHVDGYFVFDADNLLAPSFITEMNRAFASGAEIVTAYRNTKNFDTNVISSAYGIHFYNNSLSRHRPRSVLGVGTHLTGTGYLISSALLRDGWPYTTFTEDDQITMKMAGTGHTVAYCEAAEFYDEQPIDFHTAVRQRVRWAKGRLTNFFKYGRLALTGIFRYRSFTCYDIFTHYFPFGLFNWLLSILYPLCSLIAGALTPGGNDYRHMLFNLAVLLGTQYIGALLAGVATVLRERRHIHCSTGKLIAYTLAYPWFDMINIPIYLIAICTHVEWKPIVHTDNRKIDSLIRPQERPSQEESCPLLPRTRQKVR